MKLIIVGMIVTILMIVLILLLIILVIMVPVIILESVAVTLVILGISVEILSKYFSSTASSHTNSNKSRSIRY